MDNVKLARLAERLLRAGVAPRYVRRSVEELRAHRADLMAQLSADGLDTSEAGRVVDDRLGSIDAFFWPGGGGVQVSCSVCCLFWHSSRWSSAVSR